MPHHCRSSLRMRHAVTAIAILSLTSLLWGVCPGRAPAQDAIQAALEELRHDGPIAPEERAELYETLRRHALVVDALSETVKAVAKLIRPAVVHIEADDETRSSGGRGRFRLEEAGSGVIIHYKGEYYVLTNRHVVSKSSLNGIRISLADGRKVHPTHIETYGATDIAVMTISAPNLVAAPVGDSDQLEIGDFVLAVGSPFGLTHSVTFGIVSAKSRRDLELGDADVVFQDFIQSDAAINPGNSGGPLVNLRGEIVGINTAIASNSGGNEGIGFSIPINMVMFFSQQLIEQGKVTRAFLGVRLEKDFGPEEAAKVGLPPAMGAMITRITEGAPAEAARLRVGDVVLQFNGVAVEDDAHLINLVGLTAVGAKVSLLIFRDGKPLTVEVKVGNLSKFYPRR